MLITKSLLHISYPEKHWKDKSLFLFYFCPCGILVPRPGMEPMPPTVEGWILNHWTPREIPRIKDLNGKKGTLWVPATSLGEFFYNLEVEKILLTITQNPGAWGGKIDVFDFMKIQRIIVWGKKTNEQLEEDLHLNYRKGKFQEFPGGPEVRTALSMPRAWIPFLFGELRSHKLQHSVANFITCKEDLRHRGRGIRWRSSIGTNFQLIIR